LRDVDPGRAKPQDGQSVWRRVGKRLEQERVDDTEHRGVRSDADRERRDDDDGEACGSPEGTKSVADILQKIGHRPLDAGFGFADNIGLARMHHHRSRSICAP